MAAKRPVKKTGKKTKLKRGANSTQAKKPVGRKKPVGAGRKTTDRTKRARKTGKASGLTTREPMRRSSGRKAPAKAGRKATTARKAVRSGRTTARKTRKRKSGASA